MASKRPVKDYRDMTDAELDSQFDRIVAEAERTGTPWRKLNDVDSNFEGAVPVSLRVPAHLLERLQDEAGRSEQPFESLLLQLLDEGLDRLNR